jgi:Zn-dependent protease
MRFSRIELRDLAICWLALGFCFSLQYLIPNREIPYARSLAQFALFFCVALIGIGTGFLFHEMAHKGVAQRFGYHAEFRMWKMGLVIAVASALLSFGQFLFFAPGAVYTSTYKTPDPKEEGLISLAGPLANVILAGLFFLLARGSTGEDLWGIIGAFGFQVNLWLAAFNLIPFPPLDGVKILRWNKAAWAATALVSWGLLALLMFGVIKL